MLCGSTGSAAVRLHIKNEDFPGPLPCSWRGLTTLCVCGLGARAAGSPQVRAPLGYPALPSAHWTRVAHVWLSAVPSSLIPANYHRCQGASAKAFSEEKLGELAGLRRQPALHSDASRLGSTAFSHAPTQVPTPVRGVGLTGLALSPPVSLFSSALGPTAVPVLAAGFGGHGSLHCCYLASHV